VDAQPDHLHARVRLPDPGHFFLDADQPTALVGGGIEHHPPKKMLDHVTDVPVSSPQEVSERQARRSPPLPDW